MSHTLTAGYTSLDSEWVGPVLHVWLDRPHKLNATDSIMLREIGDLFIALELEHDARVVVLGGRGRSFSVGADRSPDPDPDYPTSDRGKRWHANLGRRACRAIENCAIPTIARVQGHAIGGGMCLAMSCDFRITTPDTAWYLPEVELGVPLTWAAIPRLAQEIGTARARQLVMLSDRITGATAADWAAAHACVSDADLDTTVQAWADRISELPELAVDMTKTTFRGYHQHHSLGDASEADVDLIRFAQADPAVAENFGLTD